MSKRPVENLSDISHAVNTHSKALEHVTVKRRMEECNMFAPQQKHISVAQTHTRVRIICEVSFMCFHLMVLKIA